MLIVAQKTKSKYGKLSIPDLNDLLIRPTDESLGVRQLVAAFNDGINSVPSEYREINFAKQGGNKLPHSKVRLKSLT